MTIACVSFRKKEFLELAIACHRDEKSSSRSARIRVYEQRSHFRGHVSEHTRNVNANRKGLARTVQFPCDVSISIAVNSIAAPSFRGPFNPLSRRVGSVLCHDSLVSHFRDRETFRLRSACKHRYRCVSNRVRRGSGYRVDRLLTECRSTCNWTANFYAFIKLILKCESVINCIANYFQFL